MTGTITPIGVGTATLYNRLVSAGAPTVDLFADPGSVNAPIIFEPPAGLTQGDPEIWVVATGSSTNYGGCIANLSSDGDTYSVVGTIFAGARQGVLTTILPSGADPDTTDTLAVDLTMSNGQLISGTKADADGLVTLCYCDGELVSYETATLTSAYHYGLTYLRRGVYGTAINSHAIGTQFARFGPNDPSVLKYVYPASFVGRSLYLKLQAFNFVGQEVEALDTVEATQFSLTGAGIIIVPNNPVITDLATGVTPEDWGLLRNAVIAAADFGTLHLAAGLDIDLGALH